MLLTSSWYVDLTVIISLLLFLVYRYLNRNRNFWKDRSVEYIEPVFALGNLSDVLFLRKPLGIWLKDLYDSVSGPVFGIFMFDEPGLVVKSPEIVRDILIKDFNSFTDRSVACPAHNEITRNMMFFQRGEQWKTLRSKLTPVFTSGKLKGFVPIFNEYALKLVNRLKQHPDNVNVKEFASDYVMDGITKCFFGIESYSQDAESSQFKLMIEKINRISLKTVLSRVCYFFYPKLVNPLKIEFGDQNQLEYFCDAFLEAMKARESSKTRFNDFIDIINDMRKDEEFAKDYDFTGKGALGQPFMFFIAGHNTTTITLTYALYEISKHPEIQGKLREAVLKVSEENGGITYEGLSNMKYMDLCMKEVLRKYPPLPFLDRRCNKTYKIRGTDLVLHEGQHVYIPSLALHYDDKNFPEPEKFDPERFEDKNNINKNGVYYIPFGEGPRSCIGERIGTLNTKMALAHILSNFVIEPTPGLSDKLTFDTKSFTLDPIPGSIKLNFRPLNI